MSSVRINWFYVLCCCRRCLIQPTVMVLMHKTAIYYFNTNVYPGLWVNWNVLGCIFFSTRGHTTDTFFYFQYQSHKPDVWYSKLFKETLIVMVGFFPRDALPGLYCSCLQFLLVVEVFCLASEKKLPRLVLGMYHTVCVVIISTEFIFMQISSWCIKHWHQHTHVINYSFS